MQKIVATLVYVTCLLKNMSKQKVCNTAQMKYGTSS